MNESSERAREDLFLASPCSADQPSAGLVRGNSEDSIPKAVGQAFQPDPATTQSQGVRLESLTYEQDCTGQTEYPAAVPGWTVLPV